MNKLLSFFFLSLFLISSVSALNPPKLGSNQIDCHLISGTYTDICNFKPNLTIINSSYALNTTLTDMWLPFLDTTNLSYLTIDRFNVTNTTYRTDYNYTWVGILNVTQDALINNVTVGLGAGSQQTNVVLGNNALSNNTVNSNIVAIGYNAAKNSGGANSDFIIAIGSGALSGNFLSGNRNSDIAIGFNSMSAFGSGSNYNNVGIGSYALQYGGLNNVVVGNSALATNGVATNNNVVVGANALVAGRGDGNTALGFASLTSASYGGGGAIVPSYNTGIGYLSLASLVSGSSNVALGSHAGRYELDSNAFYVDNQDRVNTTGDKIGALLYGNFNSEPANQTLVINAKTTVAQNLNVTGTLYSEGLNNLTIPFLFNSTGLIRDWSGESNSSWNQSYADLLYQSFNNITNVSYLTIDRFNVTNTSYMLIENWNATNTTYALNQTLTDVWSDIINVNYNATGLIQDWNVSGWIRNQTIAETNWNASGLIQNWNTTGYLRDWTGTDFNASGLIRDWNNTGWIRNQTTAETNWNASGWIANWNTTGYIRDWSGGSGDNESWNQSYAQTELFFLKSQWNVTNSSYLMIDRFNVTNISYALNQTLTDMWTPFLNSTNSTYNAYNSSGWIRDWSYLGGGGLTAGSVNATHIGLNVVNVSHLNTDVNTSISTFYFTKSQWNVTNSSYLMIDRFNVTNISYALNQTLTDMWTSFLSTTNSSYLMIDKFNITNSSYVMIDRFNVTNISYRHIINGTFIGDWNVTGNLNATQNLNVTGNLISGVLTAGSCDVKSYTNGTLYCGTDASGSGSYTTWKNVSTNTTRESSYKSVTAIGGLLNIASLNTSLNANRNYSYECHIIFMTNVTSTGIALGMNTSVVATPISGIVRMPVGVDGAGEVSGTLETNTTGTPYVRGTGVEIVNTNYTALMYGQIHVGTARIWANPVFMTEIINTGAFVWGKSRDGSSYCKWEDLDGIA